MRNENDKQTLLNLDVLVMEHLFYSSGPKINRCFDFKGIRDRQVNDTQKSKGTKDLTLWDGDWLSGYRFDLPVYEQSRALIEAAIKNDTEFLARCNIMDYSLLTGVDDNKKELTVGIVGKCTIKGYIFCP